MILMYYYKKLILIYFIKKYFTIRITNTRKHNITPTRHEQCHQDSDRA